MTTKLVTIDKTTFEFSVPDLDEDIAKAKKKGKRKKLARYLKAQSCPHDDITSEWTVWDYWAYVCADCRLELSLKTRLESD